MPFQKTLLVCGLIVASVLSAAEAEAQGRRRNQETQTSKSSSLPNDPKLFRIHKEFATEAMKIANNYARDRDFDAAMAVYGQVLRLIPEHPEAKEKLKILKEREKQADQVVLKVDSTQPWQTTGVRVIANKPITILSKGSWTFTLQRKLTPDGMAIPKNLKDFNLGCLVGYIDTGATEKGKPFIVGAKKQFMPKQTGVLYLQMYDSDLGDNEGSIDVQITGTFERVTRGRGR